MSMETVVLSSLKTTSLPSGAFSLFAMTSSSELIRLSSDSVFIRRGEAVDCDEATDFGLYYPNKDCKNCPVASVNTSDVILFIGRSAIYGRQLYIPLSSNGAIYSRTHLLDHWSDWVVIIPKPTA